MKKNNLFIFRKKIKWEKFTLLGVIILIFASLSIFVDNFATINNFTNILVQVAPIGIMACGITYVMISGGIDVSLPAVMAASAVIAADYMAKTGDLVFGPILMITIGAILGMVNGFAIAYLKMVPLVVTLSMMTICLGISTTWTGGQSVTGLSPMFSIIFGKYTSIFMFIVIAIILGFILKKTIYGRWLYYIGNNINTAKVSGVPTKFTIFAAYVICGMCAGVAGIINTAALSSARATMGPDSQILDIVSAAVIGGVSVKGGVGTIPGAASGAILIIMINNVMNLVGVSDYFTGLIKGSIIILAMALEVARRKFRDSQMASVLGGINGIKE